MAKLEELKKGAVVKGILPDSVVTVIDVEWHGADVITLTYKDSSGQPASVLVFRDREPMLEIMKAGLPWSFEGDGSLYRLVSEAYRIRLAHLFDPYLAIHTSNVEPLPHQITAVYGEMLPRQPLRFLLADDPGAGKTIMTGLFIKELMLRGDLSRCLIVCPGSLAEQWQDELSMRFGLPFEILTNDRIEAARTGNVFREMPLLIARLDKLSRNEDLQAKLSETDWDLIVCDEAHKMSASFFGGEVRYTRRYHLGQLLSTITRHFLLLTATPHNGKEEDFQLFMALLDGDRFEGRFRDGVHSVDVSDLMRRMVKEDLVRFDGRPLFPERIAYTINYSLSDAEIRLYDAVTRYVKEEFNRAEKLENEGRKGTVGFALTTLQRRLASSPEAIYQSLRRRRERLEVRLREEKLGERVASISRRGQRRVFEFDGVPEDVELSPDQLDDLYDAPSAEAEETEETIVDQATAASTVSELEAEIRQLSALEKMAAEVRAAGTDRKWDELSKLLQDNPEMFDANGLRRKLVVFTEHRDTLNYLADRIRSLLGKPEAVVTISGSMGREERRKAQEAFTQDKDVLVLVATDAAGEGINLQRAHLMVNYDLPWNPNRLEQRFGRIHRIGQTEVCHLWNLVAYETREGEVFQRLFEKLEEERKALGGRVFDVLGKLTFENRSLKDLLIEAIRYGDQPEVRERLNRVVDKGLDRQKLQMLLKERALAHDSIDARKVMEIREEMERIEARRLQPHFIAAFFREAFERLGGRMYEREPKRFEITHVPAAVRNRDRLIGVGNPVMPRYERVTFEKDLVHVTGRPLAEFICPGHPLLDAVVDIVLERHRDLLKLGAVLVDSADGSDDVRMLVCIEHSIRDAHRERSGGFRTVSKRLQFVEMDASGNAFAGGPAPYLDYRPATAAELDLVRPMIEANWLAEDLEGRAIRYAAEKLVPSHWAEVKRFKEEMVRKTMAAVKERLTKEIVYWDHRARDLAEQERAGKINANLNSQKARQRADELEARLKRRMQELEEELHLAPQPPVVLGGAIVVPQGLIEHLKGNARPGTFATDTRTIELAAMEAVIEAERSLGFEPRDVSAQRLGYDIESRVPGKGRLRFIEVKGRQAGATTVTITKNEILTALNKPDDFILAIVEVEGQRSKVTYVSKPFSREPDFGVTSVTYDISELLSHGTVVMVRG